MKQLTFIITLLVIAVCASCVQKAHPKVIQFKLDMRHVKNIKNVGIRGSTNPLSWNKTLELTDENKDSIYERTIKLNSASFDIAFKFVHQDSIFELKNQPNRSIEFEYKPETITYETTFNNTNSKISKKDK